MLWLDPSLAGLWMSDLLATPSHLKVFVATPMHIRYPSGTAAHFTASVFARR